MLKHAQIKEKDLKEALELINTLKDEVKKRVIGQDVLIRNLLIALFARWHIILEWVPWLAKTLSIEVLSKTLHLTYKRIQFTPDLLPSDLIWSRIYNQHKWEFYVKKWPVFANFILTDEINRAPSKVQSALLEAMEERQVTIWDETFKLDKPFIVLATQNPLEQEWTYALPEAQIDRFLLKTIISYPTEEEEIQIIKNETWNKDVEIAKIMTVKDIEKIQDIIQKIYVSDDIFDYVKNLTFATRFPDKYWIKDLKDLISYWASPRASIALIKTAKIMAFFNARDAVTPEDIKEIAYDVLRHRLIPSFEAVADNVSSDDLVKMVLDWVNTP